MVDAFYQGAEGEADQPAQDIHHCLKQPEMPGKAEGVPAGYLRQADAGSQSNGKGIDRQGNGNDKISRVKTFLVGRRLVVSGSPD